MAIIATTRADTAGFGSEAAGCHVDPVRFTSQSGHARTHLDMSALCHNRTHTVQLTSGRAFPAVSFVYLSVECLSNKFYGINCRPKLGAKLLDRFFHRRRQVSPPVNPLTHRLFDR